LCFYAFNNRLKTDAVYVPEISDHTFSGIRLWLDDAYLQSPPLFENNRFLVTAPVNVGYGVVQQYYASQIGSLQVLPQISDGCFFNAQAVQAR
jgi:hypothetical protein